MTGDFGEALEFLTGDLGVPKAQAGSWLREASRQDGREVRNRLPGGRQVTVRCRHYLKGSQVVRAFTVSVS